MTSPRAALGEWEGRPPDDWTGRLGIAHFEAHATIGSTNDRLRELVANGLDNPACVVADEQTAGRGRVGRRWISPAGGLWCSVFLPVAPQVGPVLPLVAGVAAASALEAEFDVEIGLKWPNDLLLAGEKLGGVLCEGVSGGVVIGVGINVTPPDEPVSDPRAANLGSLRVTWVEEHVPEPRPGSRGRVLEGVVRGLLEGSKAGEWPRTRFGWVARDVLAGRRVVCSVGVQGIARGIDESGGLVVECREGQEIVRAGSVRIEAAE